MPIENFQKPCSTQFGLFVRKHRFILGNMPVFGRVVISVHLLGVTTYVGANKELFNEHICYLNTSDA
jgi:hypothetical protein